MSIMKKSNSYWIIVSGCLIIGLGAVAIKDLPDAPHKLEAEDEGEFLSSPLSFLSSISAPVPPNSGMPPLAKSTLLPQLQRTTSSPLVNDKTTSSITTVDPLLEVAHKLHRKSQERDKIISDKETLIEEASKKKKELTMDKKDLQDLIEVTSEKIHRLKQGLGMAHETIRRLEKEFLKDVGYGTMAKEDLPLAIKATNNTAEDGMGGVDCPMDCDPKICDNSPTESTQCFKVDRSSGKKQHLCKPFEKVETLRCPQDFVRCAMAAPAKGKIYTLVASESSKEPVLGQPIIIEGYNLHQCLRLLFVPEDVKCVFENMNVLVQESISIMGLGGSQSYPHIAVDPVTKKTTAEFASVNVLKPGNWKVCLVQFAKPQGATDTVILGLEPIGTLRAITKKSLK